MKVFLKLALVTVGTLVLYYFNTTTPEIAHDPSVQVPTSRNLDGPATIQTRKFPTPRSVTFPPIKKNAKDGLDFGHHRLARYEGCLRYECAEHTEPHCRDNDFAETDYTGEHPPCCKHILRDMIRVIDEAMSALGLEYFAGYGSLLGLVRNDYVIPWTADNDFVVSFAVANEIWKQQDFLNKEFGLRVFNDFYLRMCVEESFMGGALARWKTHKYDELMWTHGEYVDHFPYADFFYGEVDPISGQFVDERACAYNISSYFPATRLEVYKDEFSVSVPKDYMLVLDTVFGDNWKVPDSSAAHGHTKCHAKGKFRKWHESGVDQEWIDHWNELLDGNVPV